MVDGGMNESPTGACVEKLPATYPPRLILVSAVEEEVCNA